MRARLLLPGALLLAFGGSLVSGFHLDDYAIFSDPLLNSPLRHSQPLTFVTFWLNHQVGGQDPLLYHALNLLLHLGAVLLAYECLRRLLPERAALLAAALFAVHPLQAEPVNYVAARGVMLAALLCFTALLAWLEGKPWLAVGVFAAALLASPQVAGFPLLLLLLDRKRPAPLAALFVLAIAVARPNFALAQGVVIWRYLRLAILPWGFTIDPAIPAGRWLAVLAWLGIVGAGVALWRWRATWVLAGLLLLVSAAVMPSADSHAYLAWFAFAAAAGILLARVQAPAVPIALVVVLVTLSAGRTYVWMSEERLWREAVRRAPDKVRPKIQLAKAVKATEALELLNQARELAPYDAEIPAETGKVLLDEQQFDSALTELSRALALDPRNALVWNNRGVTLAALGQMEAARADFEHALAIAPDFAEAQENLKRVPAR